MKKFERTKALSSLFYPKFWKDMKALLQKCEMISDSMKALEIEAIVDIEFILIVDNVRDLISDINNGEKAAMMEAGIKRQSYFKKIFDIAEGQRVIRKTNDRCGRVVVMLIPL